MFPKHYSVFNESKAPAVDYTVGQAVCPIWDIFIISNPSTAGKITLGSLMTDVRQRHSADKLQLE